MHNKKLNAAQVRLLRQRIADYPQQLFECLLEVARDIDQELFITGGALRDWLLGESPRDLDFTITHGALEFLGRFKEKYGTGTIVPLGIRHDDTCRIVLADLTVDVSGFRLGTAYIEQDLKKRDFSINAMAVRVEDITGDGWDITVIDPMDGLGDMYRKVITSCPGAFADDPLRMVRAFRFSSILGYRLSAETRAAISARINLINMSSVERISSELDQIMAGRQAHQSMVAMDKVGLLEWLIPELQEGDGVGQPAFHHLDVLQHNILALYYMERIIEDPHRYFGQAGDSVAEYLDRSSTPMLLKWAALLHDIGKPSAKKIDRDNNGRITFYGHDQEGAEKIEMFAERMRWSRKNRDKVCLLVEMHMHPFHLCNVIRTEGSISDRSKMKICRKAGPELTGLFMLAMADSLAGQGEDKPEHMERDLRALFDDLDGVYRTTVEPVLKGPKLLTGHDLVNTLGLSPGPEFREILEGVELAVMEKEIATRQEALDWVQRFLQT